MPISQPFFDYSNTAVNLDKNRSKRSYFEHDLYHLLAVLNPHTI
jgi:hypothetical protein